MSVLEVQLTVGHVMNFGLEDGTPGSLVVLHVERAIFHQVIPELLEDVAKILGLYEPNILSAIFLPTVIF